MKLSEQVIFSEESILTLLGIIVTIIISIVGAIYAIATNTKKYELTENYRCEIFSWYREVVKNMIAIIHLIDTDEFYMQPYTKRQEYLAELSTLAEIGRFYFPNVIKGDNFGAEKPCAYQGYRHIVLEFILHFYYVASKPYSSTTTDSLWKLERQFTSFIFDMIKPRKRNKEYRKYLSIIIPEGKAIEDFLAETPQNIFVFR